MAENVLSLKYQNTNLGSVNFRLHVRQIYIKILSFPGFAQCMCTKNGKKVVFLMQWEMGHCTGVNNVHYNITSKFL